MVDRTGDASYCPGCGGRIWRLSGDKFLKCHRCEWTVSYPILRWVTQPTWVTVYLNQFRKHPVSTLWEVTKVAAVLLLAGLVITGTVSISP